jgi:hypothetical protein
MHRLSQKKNKRRKGHSVLINKTIETEEGTVKFEGELEQAELDLVLSLGLNFLLQQGCLPFTTKGDVNVEDADEDNIQ